MTSQKREALWCWAAAGVGLLGSGVLVATDHPVLAVALGFLGGGGALAGLLDWIDV